MDSKTSKVRYPIANGNQINRGASTSARVPLPLNAPSSRLFPLHQHVVSSSVLESRLESVENRLGDDHENERRRGQAVRSV